MSFETVLPNKASAGLLHSPTQCDLLASVAACMMMNSGWYKRVGFDAEKTRISTAKGPAFNQHSKDQHSISISTAKGVFFPHQVFCTMGVSVNPVLLALGAMLVTTSLVYCRPVEREASSDGKSRFQQLFSYNYSH